MSTIGDNIRNVRKRKGMTMEKKQKEIVNQLKRWPAAEVYEAFAKAITKISH